jgi:diphthamide synthase (EF-2-diphthine--ammonia ligase)
VQRAVAGGFTHVAFGDLFLEDVRKYREDRMAGTGLTPLFPLWGLPTPQLARDMIAGGLRARLSTIDPRVMPRELAGAHYDEALLARLPASVDPCGENGEFHTCVTAGPMFSTALELSAGETVERDGFVYADLALPLAVARTKMPAKRASYRERPSRSASSPTARPSDIALPHRHEDDSNVI